MKEESTTEVSSMTGETMHTAAVFEHRAESVVINLKNVPEADDVAMHEALVNIVLPYRMSHIAPLLVFTPLRIQAVQLTRHVLVIHQIIGLLTFFPHTSFSHGLRRTALPLSENSLIFPICELPNYFKFSTSSSTFFFFQFWTFFRAFSFQTS